MNKFKSKKGFTLAELLIVVAIIAILVAIAVPLFVGALNEARENVKNANIRAVRGAAVTTILTEDSDAYETDGKLVGPWYAIGVVNSNGEISKIYVGKTFDTVLAKDADNKGKYNSAAPTNGTSYAEEDGGSYYVSVYIGSLTFEAVS